MAKSKGQSKATNHEPVIENRRARYDYAISDTVDCGIKLTGTEIKSVRLARVNLAEGFARADGDPAQLTLHNVHIGEYPNAASHFQHQPVRDRIVLANRREIDKLAQAASEKGVTLVPLRVHFVSGRAKVVIGIGRGKKSYDKRESIKARDAKRDMDRALKGG